MGAHLLSMAEELDYEVYYWREPARNKDEKDKEVDFVLVRDGEVTAIEVNRRTSEWRGQASLGYPERGGGNAKRNSGRRGMNAGLPAFVEAFHPKRSFVVGTGGVSLEDFLGSEVETLL